MYIGQLLTKMNILINEYNEYIINVSSFITTVFNICNVDIMLFTFYIKTCSYVKNFNILKRNSVE